MQNQLSETDKRVGKQELKISREMESLKENFRQAEVKAENAAETKSSHSSTDRKDDMFNNRLDQMEELIKKLNKGQTQLPKDFEKKIASQGYETKKIIA